MNDDMAWVAELKDGDTVFVTDREGVMKHAVTRVTAKQIIVGEHWKFRREDGREIGADVWNHHYLRRSTPEMERAYLVQQARRYLAGARWSQLSDDAVVEIAGLVKTHQPKVPK